MTLHIINQNYSRNSRPVSNINYNDLSLFYNYKTHNYSKTTTETINCLDGTSKQVQTKGTSIPICNRVKQNPLKHWRKQLKPYYETKSSTQISCDTIPHKSETGCNNSMFKTEVFKTNGCNGIKIIDENNKTRCYGGSYNVKRYGSNYNNKKYCYSSSQYLQRRMKTFEQNQNIGKNISKNTYEPSSYQGLCKPKITLKINNIGHYSQNGAVSSSSNINRIKYNATRQTLHGKNYATYRTTLDNGYLNILNQTNKIVDNYLLTPYRNLRNHKLICRTC